MVGGSMSSLAAEKDMVILHTIPRGKTVPNISPFALKLETFLKFAKITYKFDSKKPFGPNGKTPWITINGQIFTDSQLIIEYLTKKFNLDTWGDATPEQKAVARAARLSIEEHAFWGMARWRFIEGVATVPQIINISGFRFRALKLVVPGRVKKMLHAQGLGRQPYETIMSLTMQDFRDLSVLLGSKQYFLGESITEVDCAFFGFIANALWAAPGSPYQRLIENELLNLKEYCERLKRALWPDWDEVLHKKTAK